MPRRISIDGHYSRCDICGDGYDRIIVNIPARAGQVWRCETNSRCHGDKQLETTDPAEVQQFLSDNEYLMATRAAIRKYLNLVRSVETWRSANPTPVNSAPAEADEELGPEVIAVMPDEIFASLADAAETTVSRVREWAHTVRQLNEDPNVLRFTVQAPTAAATNAPSFGYPLVG